MLPEVPVTVNWYTPSVVLAEVVAVRVVVPLVVTELEESVHLGSVAFDSEVVTVQLSETVPVNELTGETVMVAVSSVVAPGATMRLAGEGESVKPAAAQVVQGGACQKSPQPVSKHAKNGVAASKIRPQLPILIAAPLRRSRATPSPTTHSQGSARTRILSRRRTHTPSGLYFLRRRPSMIRLSLSPCPRLIDS